ncbi:DUF4143 domain-containing protein [Mesorhizobium sp. IRAMC:0171]|uniref:DUF4143 domain-containing protein n=1 Tax=Mesorhizobium retamae TaxID=2912854 RepID=A0ABS9QLV6_9HYPH|nr:DUF4143 domain-containing protein [Mesorhizobium sp. IRAMC:0171]MCG7508434.1 DUF4143 domain-containing protein [Mesorhizobium sp. IRAMC:0171]
MNAAEFAGALGVDNKTVASYLDLMVDLLLVRRLELCGKRLVKSPRVYVHGSGLLDALLGLETLDDVLGHPVSGASWEGFVIETLISALPEGSQPNFYRSSAGAEIDVVLTLVRQQQWPIEIKRSLSRKLSAASVTPAKTSSTDTGPGASRTIRWKLVLGLRRMHQMHRLSISPPAASCSGRRTCNATSIRGQDREPDRSWELVQNVDFDGGNNHQLFGFPLDQAQP